MKNLSDFSGLAVSRTVSSALRSLFFIVVATLMEPNDYGEMSFLIALAGTFSIVSRFGLPSTVIVYLAKGRTDLANHVNLLAIITSSIASVILVFVNEFSAFLCIASSLFFLHQRNQIGMQKYKAQLITAISQSVLMFAFGLPLFFVAGIPGLISGIAISNIVMIFPLFRYISLTSISVEPIKENYKVILNNFGVDSANNLVRFIDKILIGAWFGFLSLGTYNFNMQILFAVEILSTVMYLFMLSETSRGEEHKKFSFLVVIVSVILAALVIFFAPYIIESIFPKFSDGISALQLLIVTVIPDSISLILTARMQATESRNVGYTAIVRICMLIGLISILGVMYDLIGFSIAVLASSIANLIFLYFLYKRQSSKFINP